jgi:murein DD-endopeptidase MepM/ murein hydrolase activator NlpD
MNRKWVAAAVAVLLAAAVTVAISGAGAGASATYRLPWASGESYPVLQGIRQTDEMTGTCSSGCSTHSDRGMSFAWDFGLPEGTEVLAARAGTVALAQGSWRPDHCGGLTAIADAPTGFIVSPLIGNQANFVTIAHGDGTSALYLHLATVSDGILRKAATGEAVAQGEVLGVNGKTGFTQCSPHLHFQVQATVRADWFTDSIPVRFGDADVVARTSDGVPVEGQSYVAG